MRSDDELAPLLLVRLCLSNGSSWLAPVCGRQFLDAQEVPESRIRTAISDSDVRQIQGNVHPLARPEFDRGKIADSTLLPRITIYFTPSSSQQAALSQLLSEQQDRSSPNYHRWITPQEFGARFGLSQNDLAQVTSWLESRGFVVQRYSGEPQRGEFLGLSGASGGGVRNFHSPLFAER